jgi:hypothetical protein
MLNLCIQGLHAILFELQNDCMHSLVAKMSFWKLNGLIVKLYQTFSILA